MALIRDNGVATGRLTVKKSNAQGETTQEFTVPNMVVSTGLKHIARRLIDDGAVQTSANFAHPAQMSHMAIGSNNTAAALSQKTLLAEKGRVPLAGSTSIDVDNNEVTFVATFPATVGTGYEIGDNSAIDGAIVEAGIFNGDKSDSDTLVNDAGAYNHNEPVAAMLCRTVFLPVNKQEGDSITITWVVKIS
jgi:hypothetical protein